MNSHNIHRSAAKGYGREADVYRSARPAYHPKIAETVADRFAPDGHVVELGAGTGIFTAQLVSLGVRVTAVEPVAAMRAVLVDSLSSASRSTESTVTAVDGTAEAIPMSDASIDSVIAAQSFHWFEHRRALDELARVLRPGGFLVTVWNVRDNSVGWVAKCTEAMERHSGDTPRHHTMIWRDAIEDDQRFEFAEEIKIANPQKASAAAVIDRCRSTSFIAALEPRTRDELLSEVAKIVGPLGDRFDYPIPRNCRPGGLSGSSRVTG